MSDPAPTGAAGSRPAARVAGWLAHIFAALAVRDFRYLWLGSFSSQIGMWVQVIGLGWLAYQLTGSATFLGVLALTRAAPSLLVTLPAGVFADRWDRLRIVVSTQFLAMVNASVLAWLIFSGNIEPWHLLVATAINGATHSFNMPARQALVPFLAGQRYLANAVALNAISFNSSRVIGPAMAGLLIAFFDLAACFLAQALLLALAMLFALGIRQSYRPSEAVKQTSVWRHMVDGLQYMRRSSTITGLMVISAVPILIGMTYSHFMPVVARDVLDVGGSGLGLLMSAVGAGSLVGAVLTAALSNAERKGLVQLLSASAFGVALALFALSQWLAVSLMMLALVGITQALTQAMNQTLLNLATPNEYRGRMLSVYLMTWNLEPLFLLPAGLLTDHWGAPPTILLSGLLVAGSVLAIGARLPEIADFRDVPARPGEDVSEGRVQTARA